MLGIRVLAASDCELFQQMMSEFYNSDAVLHPLSPDKIRSCFNDCINGCAYLRIYIIEVDGTPAGFSNLSIGYSTEAGGICIQIEDLYIRPEFRGRGFGRSFIERVCKEAFDHLDVKRIRLEVESKNSGAIKLYESLGFTRLDYSQMIIEAD